MPIKYEELNPIEATIELGGKEYTLRKFDLTAQVWAKNTFATATNSNGLEVLAERIRNIDDIECITKCTYHLLKEKFHIGTYENFMSLVESSQHKYLKLVEFYQALVKTLGVSQPQIEDIQEDLELKKSLAEGA